MRYDKKDCYIFISLVTVILLLSLISLDNTCYWGDDWAGYIAEGISIAEGRLNEQTKLNVIMHPSELPDEALNGSLVYVWGYPLLMALVYKLVGFDRVGFTSIIYYKIPSAIALALLAGIMYLFLRRRSGKAISFLLSFLFCACYEFRVFINTLYSDMIFLFFAMLSLLLVEVFLDEQQRVRQYVIGFALGVALWFTYEVRLNGISILFACIVACLVFLIQNRRKHPSSFTQSHKLPVFLFPFAIFILLKLISEGILAPATGNTSDLSAVTMKTLWGNLVMYYNGTRKWLGLVFDDALINWINMALTSMTDTGEDTYGVIGQFCANLNSLLVTLFLLCTLIGFIIDGFRREIHLSIYALMYLIVVCMLPYNQGIRYVYPVMMLIPVYASYIYIYIYWQHIGEWKTQSAYNFQHSKLKTLSA